MSGEELVGLLEQLWGQRAPATWNRNRGAVAAWLSWCAASRLPAPVLPASAERHREHINATRAVPPASDRPGAVPPRRAAADHGAVTDDTVTGDTVTGIDDRNVGLLADGDPPRLRTQRVSGLAADRR